MNSDMRVEIVRPIKNSPDIKHMAATQNEVLAKLGSSLRISDDATYDDVRSAADGVDSFNPSSSLSVISCTFCFSVI